MGEKLTSWCIGSTGFLTRKRPTKISSSRYHSRARYNQIRRKWIGNCWLSKFLNRPNYELSYEWNFIWGQEWKKKRWDTELHSMWSWIINFINKDIHLFFSSIWHLKMEMMSYVKSVRGYVEIIFRGRALAYKIIRQWYFWPTIQWDALELAKNYDKCQTFVIIPK